MKNTLTSLLLAGTVALSGASVGCKRKKDEYPNSYPPRPALETNHAPSTSEKYDTSWNVKGNLTNQVKGSQSPFSLEYFVRDGGQYAVAKAVNPRTNEHPNIIVYAMDNTSLVVDDDEMKVEPLSTRVYVPTHVTNPQGELLNKVKLSTKGLEGVRTKRQAITLDGNGVPYGIVKYSEADADYSLNTIKIADEEFYAPLTQSACNVDSLNFYLIPVNGTKREITPNGAIVLHSGKGVYSLNQVWTEDYNARTNENQVNVTTNNPPQYDNSSRVEKLFR